MKPVKARNLLHASRNICNVRFELQQAGRRRPVFIRLDQESNIRIIIETVTGRCGQV